MDKSERSKAAGAAGIAALISKARKLHAQSEAMIKQAQEECKHANTTSYEIISEMAYDDDSISYTCVDCGKRWIE